MPRCLSRNSISSESNICLITLCKTPLSHRPIAKPTGLMTCNEGIFNLDATIQMASLAKPAFVEMNILK